MQSKWIMLGVQPKKLYVDVEVEQLDHVIERMRSRNLTFEMLDLTLRMGPFYRQLVLDHDVVGSWIPSRTAKIAYNDGKITTGIICRLRSLSRTRDPVYNKSEALEGFYMAASVSLLTVTYRNEENACSNNLERKVVYEFDTNLLRI